MSLFSPRESYRGIRAYDVDPAECEIELADNTSPFGAPPSAVSAILESTGPGLARYPSTYSADLRRAIADYIGVAPDEVMVSGGSDEVMSCAFRALVDPPARVSIMDPTFLMARVFAITNSHATTAVSLSADFDADAPALIANDPQIVYLCSPNNPTGTLVSENAIAGVLAGSRAVVMLDEAYAEFAGTNVAARAPSTDRLLVLRTFSKAFGLAGMRIGYAVGARPLIAEMEKARGPFALTSLSERAALAALTHDLPWVKSAVQRIVASRDQFTVALSNAGYSPLVSHANFVLIPTKDSTAAMRALRSRGIQVRHFHGLGSIGDALRVSVADWPVMQRVLSAIQENVPCT